jgi:hypothetical protein
VGRTAVKSTTFILVQRHLDSVSSLSPNRTPNQHAKNHLSRLTPLCYSKNLRIPKSAFAYLPAASTSLISHWPRSYPVPAPYTQDHLSYTLGAQLRLSVLISSAHDITRLVFPDPSPRLLCRHGCCCLHRYTIHMARPLLPCLLCWGFSGATGRRDGNAGCIALSPSSSVA